MKRFIAVLMTSSLLLAFAAGCSVKRRAEGFKSVGYSENVSDISKYLYGIIPVDKTYYKVYDIVNERVPGPDSYRLTGFAHIPDGDREAIFSSYTFAAGDVSFPEGISDDVIGTGVSWKVSEEFTRFIENGTYIGKVFADPASGWIYFDLERD